MSTTTTDLATSLVACPRCHVEYSWLGDYAACIESEVVCLKCRLDDLENDEEAADAMVARVIRVREAREEATGRRVLPCPWDPHPGCRRCADRGWIIGYPPGKGHLSIKPRSTSGESA